MEPIRECPHCGEPTVPNRLADGQVVCSCAARRVLPGSRDQSDGTSPADQSGMMAVASISSRASGSASATTPTRAMAGKLRPITAR